MHHAEPLRVDGETKHQTSVFNMILVYMSSQLNRIKANCTICS